MKLAENLKFYREANDLTQDAVAHELSISRQSVSKWENGESYPSIDNLIILRRLFNISIDELVMGEKFLACPFSVGSPSPVKSHFLKRPLFISGWLGFFGGLLTSSFWWGLITFSSVLLVTIFFFYTLAIDLVYQRWSLEKRQLLYLPAATTYRANLKRMLAILNKKESQLLKPLTYDQIDTIELVYEKKVQDFYVSNLFQYNWSPSLLLAMRDPFYFLVTTPDGEKIELDLWFDYNHEQLAYSHLTELSHFFQQKGITFLDPLGILAIQQQHYHLRSYIYHGVKEVSVRTE